MIQGERSRQSLRDRTAPPALWSPPYPQNRIVNRRRSAGHRGRTGPVIGADCRVSIARKMRLRCPSRILSFSRSASVSSGRVSISTAFSRNPGSYCCGSRLHSQAAISKGGAPRSSTRVRSGLHPRLSKNRSLRHHTLMGQRLRQVLVAPNRRRLMLAGLAKGNVRLQLTESNQT